MKESKSRLTNNLLSGLLCMQLITAIIMCCIAVQLLEIYDDVNLIRLEVYGKTRQEKIEELGPIIEASQTK